MAGLVKCDRSCPLSSICMAYGLMLLSQPSAWTLGYGPIGAPTALAAFSIQAQLSTVRLIHLGQILLQCYTAAF
ncbi:hypothetical protein XENTR_v10000123 [Xenopus tropicalis]|nr:hypothetical protein XENTR_v10000123 [Xenopus tropicalis]